MIYQFASTITASQVEVLAKTASDQTVADKSDLRSEECQTIDQDRFPLKKSWFTVIFSQLFNYKYKYKYK